MESKPRHSSADRDPISRMLGSTAVKPLPPMTETKIEPTRSVRSSSRGEPDFARMTPAEKVAWNLARWKRVLG